MERKIYQVALEQFLKYGIRSVSMDDIAQQLGMSKKTIYNEVENKEALVERTLALYAEQKLEVIREINRLKKDAIHEIILVVNHVSFFLNAVSPVLIFDLKKYFNSQWDMIVSLQFEQIYQTLIQNISLGREEGLYRTDFDEDLICRFHVGQVLSIFDDFLFPQDRYAKDLLYKTLMDQFIRSIGTEKGYQKYKAYAGDISTMVNI